MWARKHKSKGFTLVEILIVVVILGILAAIVIPQFTNASETAKASSLISQLQTIRSQLELYQVQHGGDYPAAGVRAATGATADWDALTATTDLDGNVAGDDFGPYLQKPASNPFFSSATATGVATDVSKAWKYTAATGQIKAVVPADKWDDAFELGLCTQAEETAGEGTDVIKGATSS